MARTKQTARRTTEGKFPRKQLAHRGGSRTADAVPDVGAALAALTLDGMDEIEPPIESPHPSASARVDQHVQQTWEEALEAAASEKEQALHTLFEAAAYRPGASGRNADA